jgi:hypothetical protein
MTKQGTPMLCVDFYNLGLLGTLAPSCQCWNLYKSSLIPDTKLVHCWGLDKLLAHFIGYHFFDSPQWCGIPSLVISPTLQLNHFSYMSTHTTLGRVYKLWWGILYRRVSRKNGMKKNRWVERPIGTRFCSGISYNGPCPQEHIWDIFMAHPLSTPKKKG